MSLNVFSFYQLSGPSDECFNFSKKLKGPIDKIGYYDIKIITIWYTSLKIKTIYGNANIKYNTATMYFAFNNLFSYCQYKWVIDRIMRIYKMKECISQRTY